jgi:anaerobic magnesium-protoporphyrin IX monomethyl ester cyclase
VSAQPKVFFITQDSAYPQMGVLYLVDALAQNNIDSEILPSGTSWPLIARIIDQFTPSVIGMSVMTAPEVADFAQHSRNIKKHYPSIPIVWGGVHATLLADECTLADYIDYIFVGQGEVVFPELVYDITGSGGKFDRKVIGHAPPTLDQFSPAWHKVDLSRYLFSEHHSVRSPDAKVKHLIGDVSNKLKSIIGSDISVLDEPDLRKVSEELTKWDAGLYETKNNIFYYLLTSRGCPYKCTFCSEPLQIMHGDQNGKFLWNAHSLDWVKKQIDDVRAHLSKSGHRLDGVGLWDDMFWVHYRKDSRAIDILRYFQEENLGYLIEARCEQLLRDDGYLFRVLRDTGCIQVFIGAESASQETLNYIKKGTKVSQFYELIKLANELKVSLRMSFIVGFPNESDESINQTLDFCEEVESGRYGAWVNISGPKIFTPYPGTIEYNRAVAAGFVPPTSHIEWGKIHRSTEEYLLRFPWYEKTYSKRTLERLKKYFGKGYKTLRAH